MATFGGHLYLLVIKAHHWRSFCSSVPAADNCRRCARADIGISSGTHSVAMSLLSQLG